MSTGKDPAADAERKRRRELSDSDFIAEWLENTQPPFLRLAGTIELLRKRSVKVFYAEPGNGTPK